MARYAPDSTERLRWLHHRLAPTASKARIEDAFTRIRRDAHAALVREERRAPCRRSTVVLRRLVA